MALTDYDREAIAFALRDFLETIDRQVGSDYAHVIQVLESEPGERRRIEVTDKELRLIRICLSEILS